MDVGALVGELAACDVATADRETLDACAEASARVRAWLDGFDVDLGRAFEAKTGYGAKTFADAAGLSLSAGERVVERGRTLSALPAIEAATKHGDVSGAHVDVATRALRQVPERRRGELAARIDGLVGSARSLPACEFERAVKVEVRRLQDDDGKPRLEQQKRASRLRSWVSKKSGMWCFRGEVDPFSGVLADKRLHDEVERLFREGAPDGCPDDPIEKQQYLAALALLSLLQGNGGGSGKPELVVVVDATQLDDDGKPIVDWDLPVDLPDDVLRDVAARARVSVVAVWPPAELNLGRSQRLASAAQRRVLRALYPQCAIPGCAVRFSRLRMHHVWWWEHGGPTDLDNLLPICGRHHSAVHDRGWKLKLLPDRTLEITLPDGTTMETGPPERGP
ncbi:MAG TPA: DUF222 domain-containing protein [Acidimicrobiales bacterium]|nr:DUF222 domain-containing protein [Acidimicrobiales bacterium]